MIKIPEWSKDGKMISGTYCGIPYTGIIESSRVCFGGDIEYRVQLMDMIEVFGEWRSSILVRKEKDENNYTITE